MHDEYQNYQNGSSVSERQQFVGELTGVRRQRLAGDGHTVYLPIPDQVELAFGLLMRDIPVHP